jgi:hypothetical protein
MKKIKLLDKNGFNYKIILFIRKMNNGNSYRTDIKIETTINNIQDMNNFINLCIPKKWITYNEKNKITSLKITHNININSKGSCDIITKNFLLLRNGSLIIIKK